MKKMMMIAAMMLMSMGAFAQNEVGQVTLKPMVGMNLASLTKGDDTKMRVGMAAGVEAEFGLTEYLGLSAGVLYSMQGVKSDGALTFNFFDTFVNFKGKSTVKLDYINVPIVAKVYLAKGLAVNVGIQPGFCVSKKIKVEGTATAGGKNISVDEDEKIDNGVKAFDFSIPLGLSYEYDDFVIDARYNWGVTKVFENGDSKNSVIQFTLGYKFAL